MEFFQKLFDTADFVPRWSCGAWPAWLAWTHMIADFVIFLAYAAIPASLAVIVAKRRDLPHAKVWLLFVAFILSCGLTHLIESLMFYAPLYRLSGLMKIATASVSVITAVALAGLLPGIMVLPRLQLENAELSSQLSRERKLAEELADARTELEDRSAMITARSRRFADALSASGAVACRWIISSGSIEWEIGLADALRAIGAFAGNQPGSLTDLIGDHNAARLRSAAEEALLRQNQIDFACPLVNKPGIHFRVSARPEPEVFGQPRQAIGMFRFTPLA